MITPSIKFPLLSAADILGSGGVVYVTTSQLSLLVRMALFISVAILNLTSHTLFTVAIPSFDRQGAAWPLIRSQYETSRYFCQEVK